MDIHENHFQHSSIFAHQPDNYEHHEDQEMIDESEEPQPPFKLTISEYEEIAQRLESSVKQLLLLK